MDTNTPGKTTRDWLIFTRSDYIATQVILGIAVAGSVLFGLAVPILDAVNNTPLPVTYKTSATSSEVELPRGATVDGNATVDLLLKDATSGERLTQALPAILIAGLTIAVAWLLFQLIRSTQAGEPFTRRNVWRINGIALMVGLGGLLVQLAGGVADNAIQTSGRLPHPDTLTLEMTFTPLPLVAMIAIALVGEAFRRGIVLREDVEGLVQLPVHEPHRIVCHLGDLLDEREMTLTALADAVGVSLVNLSIMKNNRAKAIRYSTLTAICQVLECQPGELLSLAPVDS